MGVKQVISTDWKLGPNVAAESAPVVLATDVPVSVTVVFSAAANIAQETGGHLESIDAKTPTLGQKTMAGSSPVVIASDQSAIPVITTPSTVLTQVLSNDFLSRQLQELQYLTERAAQINVMLSKEGSGGNYGFEVR